jgi:hypothetical protein
LERRNASHHALVVALKKQALSAGLRCTRTKYADTLVRQPQFGSIFEMKSARDDIVRQVRRAIAQLYHYRFLHRRINGFEHGVHLYGVYNSTIPMDLVTFLREIGIGTIWLVDGTFNADNATRTEPPWLFN